ncbi:uncharacterized protein [Haliotis cracherodii]|uniref:uncharacterized protein n=1 Tax=Haliotis cracherodii TaxID=6455 RepID=UPI0039EC3AF2
MDYRDERIYVCVAIALSCLIQVVTSCDIQTVLTALEECRHEREELNSIATRHDSNHTHICSVFEAFSQCMDPRVGECQGESTEAYRRQKEYYTGQGFNCTVLAAAPSLHVSPLMLSLPLLTASVYSFL